MASEIQALAQKELLRRGALKELERRKAAVVPPEDVRGPTGVPGQSVTQPPVQRSGWKDAAFVGQQADRGIADVVGSPVDLMSALLNGSGAMRRDGSPLIQKPFMGSDWIADTMSNAYEGLGGNVVAPEDVGAPTRMAGSAARFAGGAVAGAVPLMGPAAQSSKVLAPLAKPYASAPVATVARDAIAGAGSGAAVNVYDENVAPNLEGTSLESFGPILKTVAALIGGGGALGLEAVAEGTLGAAKNAGRNMVLGKADPNAPINPKTGEGFSRGHMDLAAQVAQAMPSNKAQALRSIDENAASFADFATPGQTPTTGMLADDIGMSLQENVMRNRDPQRFIERDQARQALASEKIAASAPEKADGRAFTGEAIKQYDDKIAGARAGVDAAQGQQAQAVADVRAKNTALEAARARQPEVSADMASDFGEMRKDARQAKNAAYDAADPKTPVRADTVDETLNAIDGSMSRAEKMVKGPYSEIASRIDSLIRERDETGAVVGLRDLTYGDVKALRAQVSEARKGAVVGSGQSVAGSGADVARLDELGRVLSGLADEINPEAARQYREDYAPKFKQGKAGEYGAALDRAVVTGGESSATRPSEFGDKFLRKPEDAASLKRAIGDKPQTAENAREWMLGDLAKSGVLTDDSALRFDRFKQWSDRNRGVINQFPKLKAEIDAELSTAQKGGLLSKKLADDVAKAKGNLAETEQSLRRSALQAAVGNSPENAVRTIMNSGDPEKQMAEMVGRLSGNRDATDGLKAAVRDWIKSSTKTTAGFVGDTDAVRTGRANLQRVFDKHAKTLAKVYTPEEMNVLRQAHKLLDPEKNLGVRATGGSDTFSKMQAEWGAESSKRMRVLEAGLKAKYGVLAGGGIYRTMTLALKALPDGKAGVEDILFEMQFNPELAKHLLTRPLKDVNSPAWNKRLNQLLAAAAGAREINKD